MTKRTHQQGNIEFRRRVKRYYKGIYAIGFILSIVMLLLAVYGNFNSSIIYIILIFCFLIPLFIIISYSELHGSNTKSPPTIHNKLKIIHVSPVNIKVLGQCIVCNLEIYEHEELLKCPICSGLAHKLHLLEWIKIKGYCPECGLVLGDWNFQPVEGDLFHISSGQI